MTTHKFSIPYKKSTLDLKLESGNIYVWHVNYGSSSWKPYYETDINTTHLIHCLVDELLKIKDQSKLKEVLSQIESLARKTGAV